MSPDASATRTYADVVAGVRSSPDPEVGFDRPSTKAPSVDAEDLSAGVKPSPVADDRRRKRPAARPRFKAPAEKTVEAVGQKGERKSKNRGGRAASDGEEQAGLSSGTETGRPLDADDSMYRGRPANVRVSTEAMFTPIIQTRAAKRASQSTSLASNGGDVGANEMGSSSVHDVGSASHAISVPDTNQTNTGDTAYKRARSLSDGSESPGTQDVPQHKRRHKKNRYSRTGVSPSSAKRALASQTDSDDHFDKSDGRHKSLKRTRVDDAVRRRAGDPQRFPSFVASLSSPTEIEVRLDGKDKGKARYISDSDDYTSHHGRKGVNRGGHANSPHAKSNRKVRYAVDSDESDDGEADLDKYDSQDSFIDDSAVRDDQSSQSGMEEDVAEGGSSLMRKSPSPPPSTQPPKPVRPDKGRTFHASTRPAASAGSSRQPSSSAVNLHTPIVRRQFGSVTSSPSTPTRTPTAHKGNTDDGPRLDDLYYSEVTSLPEECEVTDPDLQDDLLKDVYKDLPKLRAGTFESWSEATGPGMVRFSGWADICGRMSYDSCYNAINFRSHGNFVNPSRVSPLNLLVRSVPGARTRYYLYTRDRMPAMCVSSVYCKESHLLAPPDRGLRQKWMSGIFHSQEWERCVGLVCSMFKHRYVSAQVASDAMQFSTRVSFGNRFNTQQDAPSSSSMFVKVRSPSTGTKGRSRTAPSADDFSLDFEADIPVYDCRDVEMDLNRDLDRLESLPRWLEEIPTGSFVVVGYTVSVVRTDKTDTNPDTDYTDTDTDTDTETETDTDTETETDTDTALSPKPKPDPGGADGEENLVRGRYELYKYTSKVDIPSMLEDVSHSFTLPVPVTVLGRFLNFTELKAVARVHRVRVSREDTKGRLLDKFECHQCPACADFAPVFIRIDAPPNILAETYRKEYVDSLVASVKSFAVDELLPFSDVSEDQYLSFENGSFSLGARFSSLEESTDLMCISPSDPNKLVCARVPWLALARNGTKAVVSMVARLHGISLPNRTPKAVSMQHLREHVCVECKQFHAVFVPVVPKPRMPRKKINSSAQLDDEDHLLEGEENTLTSRHSREHAYPPAPLSEKDTIDIVRDCCAALRPDSFRERGCAVCGQLVPVNKLVALDSVEYSFDPLVEPGVVRIERFQMDEGVRYCDKPILDPGCSDVCASCDAALRKAHRPVNSLANGLWVGIVPGVLSKLTYAEQCLVARVRTNRYVVRVASGQSKLTANAIQFPSPTVKVYQKLPPGREELDEVIAFIFTGINPPTVEELGRTPMLVRRNAVADALNWLKLNHSDYTDLVLDEEALMSYPEHGVPVQVVFRPSDSPSNIVAAATSVHHNDDEEGTDYGPCPFTVNGLVGANLETMTVAARKATALHHLRVGGHVLAVGHSETPESIYNNHQLYPQMFPWLFPYGSGGIGNPRTRGLLSETRQKRLMLMYHDKRFQTDVRFVLIAFNHEQMKAGSRASFILAKRSNFSSITSTVSRIDPAILMNISKRLQAGERVIPESDGEKLCFSVMDQIDHVGTSIHGSMAGRKNMRSELWSLIAYKGAPSWFITLSPVDNKHPLCIYWADKNIEFSPDLRDYNERARLIAANPIAGARFFNYLVQLFIKYVLRWSDVDDRSGVLGHTAAYYGTVEQQGRMTLHLHMLIWISGAMSPQDVRQRLMNDDSNFKQELFAYLESCQTGEFLTGSMDEIKLKMASQGEESVADPTQRLPAAPPVTRCIDFKRCVCQNCEDMRAWITQYKETVDNIVFRSNVHRCYARRDIVSNGVHKQHVSGKGCINKDGVCTARFPRDIHEQSHVDKEGRIFLRKREPMINNINPVMAYCFACNTDCTSLSSGTAVNATAGYCADYIVKMSLKSYQIFSSVYDVFERNPNIWKESRSDGDAARKLILKMANTLTSKIELGGPMAAMYLLGHPDHYTSHEFVPLYWRQYMSAVVRSWETVADVFEDGDRGTIRTEASFNAPAGEPVGQRPGEEEMGDNEEAEGANCDKILLTRTAGKFVSRSHVDDYKLRPIELEHICVYEWVQCAVRKPIKEYKGPSVSTHHLYSEGHPLRDTHFVQFVSDRVHCVVPNFLGGYLPRKDSEDKDSYACAMMSLFAPWRTGLELRSSDVPWADAFDECVFPPELRKIIDNLNIRYECYDARDDFHAQLRNRVAAQITEDADALDDEGGEDQGADDFDGVHDIDEGGAEMGDWSLGRYRQMQDAEAMMLDVGWTADGFGRMTQVDSSFCPEKSLPPTRWKQVLMEKRKAVLSSRMATVPRDSGAVEDMDLSFVPINDARVVPAAYLLSDFKVNEPEVQSCIEQVLGVHKLNKEQLRAFHIVAHHSVSVNPHPLRLYLGGMGGTGKSEVIKALRLWFRLRGESHRMVVLAPTGAAAAVVTGSTFHSFLGLQTGERRSLNLDGKSTNSLDDARKRMRGVDYIFIDEISMVSCQDFYLIDSRLKDITMVDDVPFGGVSMIVAGDFAQLPPAKGLALYSGAVSTSQDARQTPKEQDNTLGVLLWHQFVTVVILRQNMRQVGMSVSDELLRGALERMRYRDCTDADVVFLRSRIPTLNPALKDSLARWRDVSVITAWNAHKDKINEMNAARFAAERGLPLHHFYSIDREARVTSGRGKKKTTAKEGPPLRLTRSVQQALWSLPPYTSEHVAASLSLCVDMPVMIRYNEATELCVTKGQEAVVKGWTSKEIAGFSGRFALETLFVELVNPHTSVQLPYLPLNVVPLTRNSTTVRAVLPNDQGISINRSQVPILLNFAMTDYVSQGKTRDVNVVDVKYCKSHQAAYTALSRGRVAEETIILREFSVNKIQGGLSGFLRQEFRALDTLDDITRLQFEGFLPTGVVQPLRASTLTAYRGWLYEESKDSRRPRKRRRGSIEVSEGGEIFKRQRLVPSTFSDSPTVPVDGWRWDSTNWSCAYDSFMTVLRCMWNQDKLKWSRKLKDVGANMKMVVDGFEKADVGEISLEESRDRIRRQCWKNDPVSFPKGKKGTDLFSLARSLLGVSSARAELASSLECSSCGLLSRSQSLMAMGKYIVLPCLGSFESSSYIRSLEDAPGLCSRPGCGGALRLITYPSLICLQLPSFDARSGGQRPSIPVTVLLASMCYRLTGIVYFGLWDRHFASRVIDGMGRVYRYNSMIQSGKLVFETRLNDNNEGTSLSTLDGRCASLVVYKTHA